MDVRFTEEQELLRRAARELLERECPMSLVRDMCQDPQGLPRALWKQMAELGWLGLPVASEHGGSGLSLLELVVLMEEMGRVLLPGPFFASTVLGGLGLELCGSEDQQRRLLPEIASGARRATLAILEEEERWDGEGIRLAARPDGTGRRLSGTKRFVQDAQSADWLIVAGRDPAAEHDGLVLALVEADAAGVSIRPTELLDATRKVAEVRLDDVAVPEQDLLPGGGVALGRWLDHARVALCAEMVGGAQRVLELSVGYAKTREQFGQPIGSFQAIQHRCADMLVALEAARSATYYAAWALRHDEPDAHVAACMAKVAASDGYAKIAGDGIQIHGGLGFTWEQDLHLYYRRAKTSELAFGDASWHRELVAQAVIDRGEPSPAG